ncbi:unnamed protein product [Cylindrotheca closterium]|uniref:Beta-mannosidase n=1 Tax=Cylindrotheca closterium TaxID=2856 RepID=A0AAD2FJS9_9STRA|nr:unnamed protein product [Cylindrotheca closterium]
MKPLRPSVSVILFFMLSTIKTFSSAFPSSSAGLRRTIHGTTLDSRTPPKSDGFMILTESAAKNQRSTETKLNYASSSIREVVQGSSLRVFPFSSSRTSRSLRIDMMTDGRPLEARVELWHGPDHCPQKVRVYSENGYDRPFRACIEPPSGDSNFAVAIKNTGKNFEFPLAASVQDLEAMDEADANPFYDSQLLLEDGDDSYGNVLSRTNGRVIQGGAIRSFNFAPKVDKIQVLLETSGLPLCARIEISQGPDSNKQVMDIFSEDGKQFPLYLAIDLPHSSSSSSITATTSSPVSSVDGQEHVMRIINAATMEYPIKVWTDSYTTVGSNDNAASSRIVETRRLLEASMDDNTNIPALRVPNVEESKSYRNTW